VIAGLPWTAWLLLVAAVLPGLVLQLVHHRRRAQQMLAGLAALPVIGLTAAGGWGATMPRLRDIDPALLRPMGAYGIGVEVLFAWSGLACAFTPVVLCSLFWKRTSRAGAIAGMVGGFLTAVVWVVGFKGATYDLYEMLPGFALTIGVSLLTEPPEGIDEDFAEVRARLAHTADPS
jgi:Na+/proline symporter